MSEKEFHKLVAAWLDESFSEIEHEPRYYDEEGRGYMEPDFVVHTPFQSYVLEVEDGWDSVKDGLGQCTLYASRIGYEPILVFPADALDVEEYMDLVEYEHAPIIETV